MNESISESTTITRQLVPEEQRSSLTAKLFGAHFPLRLEPVIYGITERMAEAYSGGYWHFYSLDNGGFYMAPDADRVFAFSCDNYYQGELSADALGIVSCLYAFSNLSFSHNECFARLCSRHYHLLRHYMYDHAEVASILGAID